MSQAKRKKILLLLKKKGKEKAKTKSIKIQFIKYYQLPSKRMYQLPLPHYMKYLNLLHLYRAFWSYLTSDLYEYHWYGILLYYCFNLHFPDNLSD